MSFGNGMRAFARLALPKSVRRSIATAATRLSRNPPIGAVDFGDLRRISPVSADWGFDRGTPIDRYYIDRFVGRNSDAIRGRVLEVGTDEYSRRFGGSKVHSVDVLHVSPDFEGATIVGDFTVPESLPEARFDCLLVTQTLNFIFDVHVAVSSIHRVLAPGGSVLATVPAISRISREDMDRWGQYWSFTSRSTNALFASRFEPENVHVEVFGNVLGATAFLQGLAAEELTPEELDHVDPDFETLIGVRAMRGEG